MLKLVTSNTNLVLSTSASTGQQRGGAGALGAMLYACRMSLSTP